MQDASSFQLSGCDYFKDRSMFVELPCRIGDDIWWINGETESVECERNGVAGFIVKKDGVFVMDKAGSIDVIGSQYCHLSKKDAEKALAERRKANAND
jgi:hypothetical protein